MSDDQLIKSSLFTFIPYYNDNGFDINITNIFSQCKYYKDLTPLNLHITNVNYSYKYSKLPKKL